MTVINNPRDMSDVQNQYNEWKKTQLLESLTDVHIDGSKICLLLMSRQWAYSHHEGDIDFSNPEDFFKSIEILRDATPEEVRHAMIFIETIFQLNIEKGE